MLAAIDHRFADVFADKEAIAAAILHPQFKTTWTDNQAIIDLGLRHIRLLLRTTAGTHPEATTGSASAAAAAEADDDDFFLRPHSGAALTTPHDELQQYLQTLAVVWDHQHHSLAGTEGSFCATQHTTASQRDC